MKTKIVSIILFFLMPMLFAEKVIIAPVVVLDQKSARITDETTISQEIYEGLSENWFEGLLGFELLSENDYGDIYTILDANKVSEITGSEYVLYGYVQKNENSWYANLKLFGKNERRIIKEFFASDEIKEKQRFISCLINNVIFGINEITGLDIEKVQNEENEYFRISLPVSVSYWNPLGKRWSSVITGIAGIDVGVEFYPLKKDSGNQNQRIDFSLGLNAGYSLGLGKDDSYPLNYHTIDISFPLMAHFYFNKWNSFFCGIAPYYEMELLKVQEKYKDSALHFQNMFGLQGCIGYEYSISSFISMRTDIKTEFHMSNDRYWAIKPGISTVICFKGI